MWTTSLQLDPLEGIRAPQAQSSSPRLPAVRAGVAGPPHITLQGLGPWSWHGNADTLMPLRLCHTLSSVPKGSCAFHLGP